MRRNSSRSAAAQAQRPRQDSKSSGVYALLKDEILSGALAPGDPIDKAALCDRLGVSRFPVSTAVARLAFEGLVEVQPQHGSFVARLNAADLRDRWFARRALEVAIAGEAAGRLTRDDRDALKTSVEEQTAAFSREDLAGFYALDLEFHRIFVDALGLPRCGEILEALEDHLERARRLPLQRGGDRMRDTLAEHRAIYSAVETGDPAAARAAMDAHLGEAIARFERSVRERPDLFGYGTRVER